MKWQACHARLYRLMLRSVHTDLSQVGTASLSSAEGSWYRHFSNDLFWVATQSLNLTKTDWNFNYKPSMVVHTCNPSTWEAEVGGSPVPGHPGLHSSSVLSKIKQNKAVRYARFAISHNFSYFLWSWSTSFLSHPEWDAGAESILWWIALKTEPLVF